MRSMEWRQLIGMILHGNIYLWLVAKKSSVSCTKRSTCFRYSLMLWKDERAPTIKHCMGRQIEVVQMFTRIQNFGQNWCEPMELEWNIFPGFTTLHLSHKVQNLLLRMSVTPEKLMGRIIFMSMFNDISWGSRDNKKECESNAKLVSLLERRFGAGQWSCLELASEKKWYSTGEDSPQGEWDKNTEKDVKRTPSVSPLSRGQLKSKDDGKWSILYGADLERLQLFHTQLFL